MGSWVIRRTELEPSVVNRLASAEEYNSSGYCGFFEIVRGF
jgi:hypothetical protein